MPHSGEECGLIEAGESWGTLTLRNIQIIGTARTDKW